MTFLLMVGCHKRGCLLSNVFLADTKWNGLVQTRTDGSQELEPKSQSFQFCGKCKKNIVKDFLETCVASLLKVENSFLKNKKNKKD